MIELCQQRIATVTANLFTQTLNTMTHFFFTTHVFIEKNNK